MSDASENSGAAHTRRQSRFWSASTVNANRSLVVCSVGALVGLAIAGAGLFSARGTTSRRLPPEAVALVNQRPILRSDFVTQLEGETGEEFAKSTRVEQLKVLDEMIQEELLVQRGLELDFAETDQPTRNALANAMTQQALYEAITSEPTTRQLEEYFARNRGKYLSAGVLAIRDFLLGTEPGISLEAATERAEKVRQELATQVPIDRVIGRYHLLESKGGGEEFYFIARARLGDRLFDIVERLSDGEVSKPFVDGRTTHIVKVIKNKPPQPLEFARARPEVLSDYKDDQQKRLMQATMTFLRGRASLLIASEYSDYLDYQSQ